MALHSISEAARLTGKSRRTIQRHIEIGKLAKGEDRDGNPTLETAELFRVYGEFDMTQAQPHGQARSTAQHDAKGAQGGAQAQIELLQLRLAHATQERDTERERRTEAEGRERQEREENARLVGVIERQMLLLQPPAEETPATSPATVEPATPTEPEPQPGFWRRLAGGR